MRILRRLGIIAVIGGIAFVGWRYRASLNPQGIRAWIAQFGAAGPWIYVALYALNTVTLLPPIGALSLSAGLAFGPVVGFAVITGGAAIGTAATFWISRRLGREFVGRRLKGRFKSLDDKLERDGFTTVLFFRFVPIVPYEVLNYASGLSRIRFRDYWLASFIGILPGAAVAAYFGDSLTQPFSPKFIIGVIAFILLMAVPVVYLKLRKEKRHGID